MHLELLKCLKKVGTFGSLLYKSTNFFKLPVLHVGINSTILISIKFYKSYYTTFE